MKKIIIYTTNDEIVSLHLVNTIVSNEKFKDFEFHILLSNPGIIRKIKIFAIILLFGSLKALLKRSLKRISINKIINKNKNCKVVSYVDEKIDYDYGLSVYCSSKIKLQNFKIYNFHLGSLKNQRGSFIFFYKYFKNWKKITLSFHEISERFDVGKVLNEKQIDLSLDYKPTEIIFAYLDNQEFLIESIQKIGKVEGILYENVERLNYVPSFANLLRDILKLFFKKLTILKP